MNPIRIGVIGSGYWGPNLIRNFFELPGANLVAVADLEKSRLDAISRRFSNVITTTNYQDFFTLDLDAAVIATPPRTHYKLARACLEHGLHLLVEKPITVSSREAEELIEIAEKRNLTLMVGHTFEYNPAVRAAKQIIDSGELGQVYYLDAVRVNLGLFQDSLDVLWDLAPHDISILRYLLGCDPIQVSACGATCIFPNILDVAYMYMAFPNNVVAHLHVSWLDPCKVRRITIVGSQKMLVYDDVEPLEKIRIYDKGVEKPPYTNSYGEFQLSYRYGDVTIPHINFTEPLGVECKHFIESIANGVKPLSSGEDGLQVVKILEMAERSLQPNNANLPVSLEQETAHGYFPVEYR